MYLVIFKLASRKEPKEPIFSPKMRTRARNERVCNKLSTIKSAIKAKCQEKKIFPREEKTIGLLGEECSSKMVINVARIK